MDSTQKVGKSSQRATSPSSSAISGNKRAKLSLRRFNSTSMPARPSLASAFNAKLDTRESINERRTVTTKRSMLCNPNTEHREQSRVLSEPVSQRSGALSSEKPLEKKLVYATVGVAQTDSQHEMVEGEVIVHNVQHTDKKQTRTKRRGADVVEVDRAKKFASVLDTRITPLDSHNESPPPALTQKTYECIAAQASPILESKTASQRSLADPEMCSPRLSESAGSSTHTPTSDVVLSSAASRALSGGANVGQNESKSSHTGASSTQRRTGTAATRTSARVSQCKRSPTRVGARARIAKPKKTAAITTITTSTTGSEIDANINAELASDTNTKADTSSLEGERSMNHRSAGDICKKPCNSTPKRVQDVRSESASYDSVDTHSNQDSQTSEATTEVTAEKKRLPNCEVRPGATSQVAEKWKDMKSSEHKGERPSAMPIGGGVRCISDAEKGLESGCVIGSTLDAQRISDLKNADLDDTNGPSIYPDLSYVGSSLTPAKGSAVALGASQEPPSLDTAGLETMISPAKATLTSTESCLTRRDCEENDSGGRLSDALLTNNSKKAEESIASETAYTQGEGAGVCSSDIVEKAGDVSNSSDRPAFSSCSGPKASCEIPDTGVSEFPADSFDHPTSRDSKVETTDNTQTSEVGTSKSDLQTELPKLRLKRSHTRPRSSPQDDSLPHAPENKQTESSRAGGLHRSKYFTHLDNTSSRALVGKSGSDTSVPLAVDSHSIDGVNSEGSNVTSRAVEDPRLEAVTGKVTASSRDTMQRTCGRTDDTTASEGEPEADNRKITQAASDTLEGTLELAAPTVHQVRLENKSDVECAAPHGDSNTVGEKSVVRKSARTRAKDPVVRKAKKEKKGDTVPKKEVNGDIGAHKDSLEDTGKKRADLSKQSKVSKRPRASNKTEKSKTSARGKKTSNVSAKSKRNTDCRVDSAANVEKKPRASVRKQKSKSRTSETSKDKSQSDAKNRPVSTDPTRTDERTCAEEANGNGTTAITEHLLTNVEGTQALGGAEVLGELSLAVADKVSDAHVVDLTSSQSQGPGIVPTSVVTMNNRSSKNSPENPSDKGELSATQSQALNSVVKEGRILLPPPPPPALPEPIETVHSEKLAEQSADTRLTVTEKQIHAPQTTGDEQLHLAMAIHASLVGEVASPVRKSHAPGAPRDETSSTEPVVGSALAHTVKTPIVEGAGVGEMRRKTGAVVVKSKPDKPMSKTRKKALEKEAAKAEWEQKKKTLHLLTVVANCTIGSKTTIISAGKTQILRGGGERKRAKPKPKNKDKTKDVPDDANLVDVKGFFETNLDTLSKEKDSVFRAWDAEERRAQKSRAARLVRDDLVDWHKYSLLKNEGINDWRDTELMGLGGWCLDINSSQSEAESDSDAEESLQEIPMTQMPPQSIISSKRRLSEDELEPSCSKRVRTSMWDMSAATDAAVPEREHFFVQGLLTHSQRDILARLTDDSDSSDSDVEEGFSKSAVDSCINPGLSAQAQAEALNTQLRASAQQGVPNFSARERGIRAFEKNMTEQWKTFCTTVLGDQIYGDTEAEVEANHQAALIDLSMSFGRLFERLGRCEGKAVSNLEVVRANQMKALNGYSQTDISNTSDILTQSAANVSATDLYNGTRTEAAVPLKDVPSPSQDREGDRIQINSDGRIGQATSEINTAAEPHHRTSHSNPDQGTERQTQNRTLASAAKKSVRQTVSPADDEKRLAGGCPQVGDGSKQFDALSSDRSTEKSSSLNGEMVPDSNAMEIYSQTPKMPAETMSQALDWGTQGFETTPVRCADGKPAQTPKMGTETMSQALDWGSQGSEPTPVRCVADAHATVLAEQESTEVKVTGARSAVGGCVNTKVHLESFDVGDGNKSRGGTECIKDRHTSDESNLPKRHVHFQTMAPSVQITDALTSMADTGDATTNVLESSPGADVQHSSAMSQALQWDLGWDDVEGGFGIADEFTAVGNDLVRPDESMSRSMEEKHGDIEVDGRKEDVGFKAGDGTGTIELLHAGAVMGREGPDTMSIEGSDKHTKCRDRHDSSVLNDKNGRDVESTNYESTTVSNASLKGDWDGTEPQVVGKRSSEGIVCDIAVKHEEAENHTSEADDGKSVLVDDLGTASSAVISRTSDVTDKGVYGEDVLGTTGDPIRDSTVKDCITIGRGSSCDTKPPTEPMTTSFISARELMSQASRRNSRMDPLSEHTRIVHIKQPTDTPRSASLNNSSPQSLSDVPSEAQSQRHSHTQPVAQRPVRTSNVLKTHSHTNIPTHAQQQQPSPPLGVILSHSQSKSQSQSQTQSRSQSHIQTSSQPYPISHRCQAGRALKLTRGKRRKKHGRPDPSTSQSKAIEDKTTSCGEGVSVNARQVRSAYSQPRPSAVERISCNQTKAGPQAPDSPSHPGSDAKDPASKQTTTRTGDSRETDLSKILETPVGERCKAAANEPDHSRQNVRDAESGPSEIPTELSSAQVVRGVSDVGLKPSSITIKEAENGTEGYVNHACEMESSGKVKTSCTPRNCRKKLERSIIADAGVGSISFVRERGTLLGNDGSAVWAFRTPTLDTWADKARTTGEIGDASMLNYEPQTCDTSILGSDFGKSYAGSEKVKTDPIIPKEHKVESESAHISQRNDCADTGADIPTKLQGESTSESGTSYRPTRQHALDNHALAATEGGDKVHAHSPIRVHSAAAGTFSANQALPQRYTEKPENPVPQNLAVICETIAPQTPAVKSSPDHTAGVKSAQYSWDRSGWWDFRTPSPWVAKEVSLGVVDRITSGNRGMEMALNLSADLGLDLNLSADLGVNVSGVVGMVLAKSTPNETGVDIPDSTPTHTIDHTHVRARISTSTTTCGNNQACPDMTTAQPNATQMNSSTPAPIPRDTSSPVASPRSNTALPHVHGELPSRTLRDGGVSDEHPHAWMDKTSPLDLSEISPVKQTIERPAHGEGGTQRGLSGRDMDVSLQACAGMGPEICSDPVRGPIIGESIDRAIFSTRRAVGGLDTRGSDSETPRVDDSDADAPATGTTSMVHSTARISRATNIGRAGVGETATESDTCGASRSQTRGSRDLIEDNPVSEQAGSANDKTRPLACSGSMDVRRIRSGNRGTGSSTTGTKSVVTSVNSADNKASATGARVEEDEVMDLSVSDENLEVDVPRVDDSFSVSHYPSIELDQVVASQPNLHLSPQDEDRDRDNLSANRSMQASLSTNRQAGSRTGGPETDSGSGRLRHKLHTPSASTHEHNKRKQEGVRPDSIDSDSPPPMRMTQPNTPPSFMDTAPRVRHNEAFVSDTATDDSPPPMLLPRTNPTATHEVSTRANPNVPVVLDDSDDDADDSVVVPGLRERLNLRDARLESHVNRSRPTEDTASTSTNVTSRIDSTSTVGKRHITDAEDSVPKTIADGSKLQRESTLRGGVGIEDVSRGRRPFRRPQPPAQPHPAQLTADSMGSRQIPPFPNKGKDPRTPVRSTSLLQRIAGGHAHDAGSEAVSSTTVASPLHRLFGTPSDLISATEPRARPDTPSRSESPPDRLDGAARRVLSDIEVGVSTTDGSNAARVSATPTRKRVLNFNSPRRVVPELPQRLTGSEPGHNQGVTRAQSVDEGVLIVDDNSDDDVVVVSSSQRVGVRAQPHTQTGTRTQNQGFVGGSRGESSGVRTTAPVIPSSTRTPTLRDARDSLAQRPNARPYIQSHTGTPPPFTHTQTHPRTPMSIRSVGIVSHTPRSTTPVVDVDAEDGDEDVVSVEGADDLSGSDSPDRGITFEFEDDDSTQTQTQRKKGKKLTTKQIFAKLHAHFSSNETLRNAMLEYKPFSFDGLHKEFTVNAKIPVTKKVLVEFLDKMAVNYYFETDRNKGRNEKAKAKRDKLREIAKRKAERDERLGIVAPVVPPKKKRKKTTGDRDADTAT